MAARLEAAGADFLVMPCNTAHVFADDILDAVGIPFVSMIDVTMEGVAGSGAKRIGLLATRACVASRVYEDAIEAAGLAVVSQTADELDVLTALIARIKTGDYGGEVRARMRSLGAALVERGADTIIVGCTEIPIVLDRDAVAAPLLSSTDLLAERTVALARRHIALPRR
jgi:aspartate racemase